MQSSEKIWFAIGRRKTSSIVSIDEVWKESKSGNVFISTRSFYITIQVEGGESLYGNNRYWKEDCLY